MNLCHVHCLSILESDHDHISASKEVEHNPVDIYSANPPESVN